MIDKQTVLKDIFGHSEFREGQEEVVDCLLSGRDALCIMSTGAGKSVCYQVPAMMLPGVTIVVSPLISLMKDQVSALRESGISAAYINSSLSYEEYRRVLWDAAEGRFKIIYVAPERLDTADFLELCRRIEISLIAVDEAHCVSQWGQDFRPSYLKIADFIRSLPYRPAVGAFTATATAEVREDILKILELREPSVITRGFDRPNLTFSVMRPKSKAATLLKLIEERRGASGIVYCATRKAVEEICTLLNDNGFSATRYHAGLTDDERKRNQEDFVFERKLIVVATNAFGMGIDKSNVKFVIHYNMPKNIESYYQEAGRAGRDGSEADCILLYSPQDVNTNTFLIEHPEPNPELTEAEAAAVRQKDYERLKYMTFYSTTSDCLREFILKYFGEKAPHYCGKCSNCLTQFEDVDITVEAQKILSCIIKTRQRFGRKLLTDVLRGSKSERIMQLGLNRQSTYGIMKDCTEKRLRDIFVYLEEIGYVFSEGGEYPIIKASTKCLPLLKGEETLTMKTAKEKPKVDKEALRRNARETAKANSLAKMGKHLEKKADEITESAKEVDSGLLNALKNLRWDIASEEKVPAYIVFSDIALIDMCRKLPQTDDEFLEVSGVGRAKLGRYGERFMEVIKTYLGDTCDEEIQKTSATMPTRTVRTKREKHSRKELLPFDISKEDARHFLFSDEPMTVGEIAEMINALIDTEKMKKLKVRSITAFLEMHGVIEKVIINGKNVKRPTYLGREIGVTTLARSHPRGDYTVLQYPRHVQEYIIENIEEIIAIDRRTREERKKSVSGQTGGI